MRTYEEKEGEVATDVKIKEFAIEVIHEGQRSRGSRTITKNLSDYVYKDLRFRLDSLMGGKQRASPQVQTQARKAAEGSWTAVVIYAIVMMAVLFNPLTEEWLPPFFLSNFDSAGFAFNMAERVASVFLSSIWDDCAFASLKKGTYLKVKLISWYYLRMKVQ
jgi:hypothetical protein